MWKKSYEADFKENNLINNLETELDLKFLKFEETFLTFLKKFSQYNILNLDLQFVIFLKVFEIILKFSHSSWRSFRNIFAKFCNNDLESFPPFLSKFQSEAAILSRMCLKLN